MSFSVCYLRWYFVEIHLLKNKVVQKIFYIDLTEKMQLFRSLF